MVEEFFKVLPTNTEENDYVIVCGNVQASKEYCEIAEQRLKMCGGLFLF